MVDLFNGRMRDECFLALLDWAFVSGDLPPDPGPDSCGLDPTDDDITCDQSPGCTDFPVPPRFTGKSPRNWDIRASLAPLDGCGTARWPQSTPQFPAWRNRELTGAKSTPLSSDSRYRHDFAMELILTTEPLES